MEKKINDEDINNLFKIYHDVKERISIHNLRLDNIENDIKEHRNIIKEIEKTASELKKMLDEFILKQDVSLKTIQKMLFYFGSFLSVVISIAVYIIDKIL